MFKLNCINLSIMLLILFLGVLYYLNYIRKNERFLGTTSVILNARPPSGDVLKPYVLREIVMDDNTKLESDLLLYLSEIYHAPQNIIP